MRRAYVVLATLFVLSGLVGAGVVPASASSPALGGSLSCTGAVDPVVATLTPPLPSQFPSTRPSKIKVPGGSFNGCDTTNVTGGSLPIDYFLLDMKGTFPKGSDCINALAPGDTLTLHNFSIKAHFFSTVTDPKTFKRRNVSLGVAKGVVVSASVSDDPYVIELVTGPVKGSAFSGQVMTVDITVYNAAEIDGICEMPTGSIASAQFSPITMTIGPPGP